MGYPKSICFRFNNRKTYFWDFFYFIDLEDGIRTEVTEYWIYTYNSETEKGECLYQVYIDVANDGYIDYVQWKYEAGEN